MVRSPAGTYRRRHAPVEEAERGEDAVADRINHVKIVSPDPAAVDRFLREVVDIPAGWPLGSLDGYDAAGRGARARHARPTTRSTMEGIMAFRGETQTMGGYITGDPSSRQFQIFQGDQPKVWGVAIGTPRPRGRARALHRARHPVHRRAAHRVARRRLDPLLLRRGRWHRLRGAAGRGMMDRPTQE